MGLRGRVIVEVDVGVEFLAVQVLMRPAADVFGIVEQVGDTGDAADERKEFGVLHQAVEAHIGRAQTRRNSKIPPCRRLRPTR